MPRPLLTFTLMKEIAEFEVRIYIVRSSPTLVPPIESGLSFSTGTFLNKNEVRDRKPTFSNRLDCTKTSKKNLGYYSRDQGKA